VLQFGSTCHPLQASGVLEGTAVVLYILDHLCSTHPLTHDEE
jgi:hypothetical protein